MYSCSRVVFFSALFLVFSCESYNKKVFQEGGLLAEGRMKNGSKIGEWIYKSDLGNIKKIEIYSDEGSLQEQALLRKDSVSFFVYEKTFFKDGAKAIQIFFRSEKNISSVNEFHESYFNQWVYFENGNIKSVSKIKEGKPLENFWQFHENGTLEMFSKDAGNDTLYIFDSLGNHLATHIYENFALQRVLEDDHKNISSLPTPPASPNSARL